MKNFGLLTVGTFFFAISVTIFSMPNSLAEGGIPGLSLLLYFGLGWSPAMINFVASGTVLLISYRYLPRPVILRSLMAIPLFSFFIFLLEGVGVSLGNPLLAALYAGVFTGVGFGFIFRSGSTIGGTSTIAKVLNYKFGWEITGTNFVLDAIIVVAGIFVIGPVLTLHTIVALFIGKRVTDYVLEGFESKKIVHIFSENSQEVGAAIRDNLGAHTTILQGFNGGSGSEEPLIYVIVAKQQLFYLKRLIRSVDEEALTVVNTVKDVSGGSFAKAYYPTQKMFSTPKAEQQYYREQAEEESSTITESER